MGGLWNTNLNSAQRYPSDPEELIRLLARAHVTRLIAVPSLLRAMLQIRPDLGSVLPHLKTWTISGEALPLDLVNLFFENAPEGSRLLNLYGSTEVAADVTCMEITLNDVMSGRLKEMGPIVPIGYPISNTDVLIVDPDTYTIQEDQNIGELFVCGQNLSNGYWNRKNLTETAFQYMTTQQQQTTPATKENNPKQKYTHRLVPVSNMNEQNVNTSSAIRYFRTGDFGWIGNNDGAIRFVGRRDQQIKVRGHRVELLEVEEAIKGMYNSKTDTVTTKLTNFNGSVICVSWKNPVRIVAYVTPETTD